MSVQASILRAIDLFEDRLRQPVRVVEAAEAAGYSLYHFCRLFSQTARLTPYEYLMRRRLSLAAQDLLHTRRKVLDIALDYQFNSSESFGRAFQRMFAAQPNRFRRLGLVDARQLLPRFTSSYLTALEALPLHPERVRHPEIRILGWMVSCSHASLEFTSLWDRLAGEIHAAGGRDPNPLPRADRSARYGLLLYPHDWQTNGCLCFAGIPAEAIQDKSIRLARFDLPVGEYACFPCESPESHLPFLLEHLFHSWIPHSHLHHLPGAVLFEKNRPDSWRILIPVDTE